MRLRADEGYKMDEMDKMGEEVTDAVLEQALRNFRSSVHAWSEAAYSQPRSAAVVRRGSWRLVVGWALGCVLAVGTVGGGVYERHHRQELVRMAAAAQAARQQQLAAEQRAREEDEDLLAKVDTDVSRTVPSAMEPLAQLMAEDENQ
jgi:hypothetical protein